MTQETRAWRRADRADAFAWGWAGGFTQIRVLCARRLSEADIAQVTGCLDYALRATLAGDALGPPTVCGLLRDRHGRGYTVLDYAWPSASSIRTDPDPPAAFALARRFLREGTPRRTTDRAGAGTQGTRRVPGLGACRTAFFVC